MSAAYIGRFAPSPTGPLHAGSLVAAMASYLDAKAHHGLWRVRIEDIDEARTVSGAAEHILQCLQTFSMAWDGEVVWQSRRKTLYQAAYDRLQQYAYPCACSRKEIADSRIGTASDGAAIYSGRCRHGLPVGKAARALRLRVPAADDPSGLIQFDDRWQGPISQNLAQEIGDFVLKRADGFWAYQLAVVVDDAEQGITDVVRGADLLDSTARQIYLQRLLGLSMPRYLHVPVVANRQGEKLSKQTGALPLCTAHPLKELQQAADHLQLQIAASTVEEFWRHAIPAWAQRLRLNYL